MEVYAIYYTITIQWSQAYMQIYQNQMLQSRAFLSALIAFQQRIEESLT